MIHQGRPIADLVNRRWRIGDGGKTVGVCIDKKQPGRVRKGVEVVDRGKADLE